MAETNGTYPGGTALRLKLGLAEMLKGGVIMDVMSTEQAIIAERAGATAVMALERVPAMIRAQGGVARMAKPSLIKQIIGAVSIPVMAKARIGHFAEAQILQHLGVDFIDESEVLTPADELHHIDKHAFTTPFVCGARDLGEALRRIAEGAAMIRTKGEAGTGDVVHAVKHMRQIVKEMKALTVLRDEELYAAAKEHRRRRADDAAGRRGRLCRVGNFHEGRRDPAGRGAGRENRRHPQPQGARGSRIAGQGHRDRDRALQRSQDTGRGKRADDGFHARPGCGRASRG